MVFSYQFFGCRVNCGAALLKWFPNGVLQLECHCSSCMSLHIAVRLPLQFIAVHCSYVIAVRLPFSCWFHKYEYIYNCSTVSMHSNHTYHRASYLYMPAITLWTSTEGYLSSILFVWNNWAKDQKWKQLAWFPFVVGCVNKKSVCVTPQMYSLYNG